MPFGTGPDEPWYYNRFLDIGPFTGSDQSNMSVQQKLNLLRGLPSLTYPTQAPPALQPGGQAPDPYREALKARGPVPTIEQGQKQIIAAQDYPADTGSIQAPQFLKDWGNDFMASMGAPGYEAPAYPSSSSGTASATPTQEAPAPTTPPQAGPHVLHPPNPTIGAPDSAPAPVPAAAPSNGVSQNSMDFVQKILQAIGYPQAPSTDNARQDAADAYAAHEMDRTRLLAQLAFASGMTYGAGGQYEGIGKGFAAAGQTYDKGFDRYQKALDDSANRYTNQQKEQYGYAAKKAGIMADLYTAGERQKLAQEKLVRDAAKDRQEIAIRMAGLMFPKPSDNSLVTMDPQTEQRRQQQIARYMQTGRLSYDVSD